MKDKTASYFIGGPMDGMRRIDDVHNHKIRFPVRTDIVYWIPAPNSRPPQMRYAVYEKQQMVEPKDSPFLATIYVYVGEENER